MQKELIITDDVNLSAKDKNLLSHDSIYKKSDTKVSRINITDAKSASEKLKSGVYAVLSVSDKAINNRLYDYNSLKANVMNGDWTNPFKKPFLRNHDLYNDMPSGRIDKAWFVDHSRLEVSCKDGQESMPEKVLNHYKDLKCFDEGTGSTIVEIMTTEDTYNRIKNGLDATVSQSSYMGKAVCNICHQDYFSGKCSHIAGEQYEIEEDKKTVNKTCYVECRDFEPIELSIVNNPANSSSILFVLDDTTNNGKNKDENKKDDSKIDNGIINDTVKGTENNTNDYAEGNTLSDEKEPKTEDLMFKDLLKKTISKNVSDRFGEEMKEHFEALFDSLDKEEQIEKLQTFLDALNIEEEPESTELEGNEDEKGEEPENNEATEDEKPEDNKEPEVEPENKLDDKSEEANDSKTKKSEDLEKIYSKNKKEIKDNVINRTVAAMLKNL